jgi:spermidine synthase
VIGDGRLSLAKEPDGEFDALIVDAFSGDAIPAHLLTREAFAMYFRKLREHGLLLVHISNAFLDLSPVVANLAADAGLSARYSALAEPTVTQGAELSSWVVLARRSGTLARFETIQPPWPVLEPSPDVDLWTDDFTNVLQVLRWKELGSIPP